MQKMSNFDPQLIRNVSIYSRTPDRSPCFFVKHFISIFVDHSREKRYRCSSMRSYAAKMHVECQQDPEVQHQHLSFGHSCCTREGGIASGR